MSEDHMATFNVGSTRPRTRQRDAGRAKSVCVALVHHRLRPRVSGGLIVHLGEAVNDSGGEQCVCKPIWRVLQRNANECAVDSGIAGPYRSQAPEKPKGRSSHFER